MEKRIQKLILLLLLIVSPLFAQAPSNVELIRLPLWASLDAYPDLQGLFEDKNEAEDLEEDLQEEGESAESEDLQVEKESFTEAESIFSYPVSQLKKTAPFIISGMVYGWNFVYVPSDKARGVEEYFEVTEIQSFEPFENLINYTKPTIEDTLRLHCWCEYKRDKYQLQNYSLWNAIQHPVIRGRGYGKVSDGFEGYKNAAKDALKNAVREHYRKIVKNKPKEITGSVLIKDIPVTGVVSGKYVINLDFFLEYGRIIEYSTY